MSTSVKGGLAYVNLGLNIRSQTWVMVMSKGGLAYVNLG